MKKLACPIRRCPACTKVKPADKFIGTKCRTCALAKNAAKRTCARCGKRKLSTHFTPYGRICSLCRAPYTLRTCIKCHESKPNSEFSPGWNDTRNSWCKACHRGQQQYKYHTTAERMQELEEFGYITRADGTKYVPPNRCDTCGKHLAMADISHTTTCRKCTPQPTQE